MSIDWNDYEPYDPGVSRPLHEVSKSDARAAFERLMRAKGGRIDALSELLRANGLELECNNAAIQALNTWLTAHVEGDPASPGRLKPMWYSVVNDIALFLGECIIARNRNLRWVLFESGRKDAAFQRHVIMGFAKVPNPKYNLDIDMVIASYAQAFVSGHQVEHDLFVRILDSVEAKA